MSSRPAQPKAPFTYNLRKDHIVGLRKLSADNNVSASFIVDTAMGAAIALLLAGGLGAFFTSIREIERKLAAEKAAGREGGDIAA